MSGAVGEGVCAGLRGFQEHRSGHRMNDVPSKLGGYLVERELGRGGMGVVYLARDPRLDRAVAIKALASDLAEHPDRLARFEREARTLAAISHPNIAVIYGMEEHLGRQLLVMEYVPGHDLGASIRAGDPMRPEEAFAIGLQIASGLEAAHEIGVVHRDLKPANIRVRPDGVVKVLDFGLAKPEQEIRSTVGQSDPTLSMTPTAEGRIMGTAGYMSPEQARGKAVDKRADIWSFGVVLFECLSGRRVFKGETPMDSIVAILERDPPWDLLPPETPERIVDMLGRCLEKNPKKRLRDIGDARIDLEAVLHGRERVDPRVFISARTPGTIDADRTGTSHPGVSMGSSQHTRLPTPLTSFIGRTQDIESVVALLDETRLVTLAGPGGCGKSRLAIEAARRGGERFRDGAWHVDLASVADPMLVDNTVGAAFGLPEAEGRSMTEQLVEAFEGRRLLLVLDNCEHVRDRCASLLSMLLGVCPGLRVIATSREPLGIEGEWVYRTGVLAVPGADDDPDAVASCDSVRLFVDRARAARPGFALNEANADDVAEICRRLDGVPLAIELAAARIKMLTPAQIAGRLSDRFRLLRSRAGDPRHRALVSAIEWSFEQLDPDERAAMRRLSVFRGGATLDAAEAVLSASYESETIDEFDVLDLLGQLVDKSLVSVVEPSGTGPAGETRYRVLESIRQYAAGLLDESGEAPCARAAHLGWAASLAEGAEMRLLGPDQAQWFERLEQEHDNLRAAISFVFDHPEHLEAGRVIAAGVWRFWASFGHIAEGRRLLLRLDRAGAGGEPTPAWARLREGIATIAMMTGDLVHAVAFARAGLELARLSGDDRTVGNLLDCLGWACLGDLLVTRAIDYFEEALQLRRNLHDPVLASISLTGLAECHRRLGAIDKARAMYEEARSTLAGAGGGLQRAAIHEGLGWLEIAAGDADAAFAQLRQAVQLRLSLGSLTGLPSSLEALACVAAMREDFEKAVRLCAAAEAGRERIACPARQSEREDCRPWRERVDAGIDPEAKSRATAEGAAMRLRRAARHGIEP